MTSGRASPGWSSKRGGRRPTTNSEAGGSFLQRQSGPQSALRARQNKSARHIRRQRGGYLGGSHPVGPDPENVLDRGLLQPSQLAPLAACESVYLPTLDRLGPAVRCADWGSRISATPPPPRGSWRDPPE